MSAKQFSLETHYGKTLFKSLPTLVSKRTHSWSLLHLRLFQLVSVHIETSMTHEIHFITSFWKQFECVLDSRTAKQVTVLAEMNATGSSGEINYGKGLFYRRPCRLWSPYHPGQLPQCVASPFPDCDLTFTSPKPHLIILFISSPGILLQSFWEVSRFPFSEVLTFLCPDKYQRHISTLRHEKRH